MNKNQKLLMRIISLSLLLLICFSACETTDYEKSSGKFTAENHEQTQLQLLDDNKFFTVSIVQ